MALTRRTLLRGAAAAALSLAAGPLPGCARPEARTFAPTRPVTRGPRFHWFGYPDKRAFDPTDRYLLANAVEFEDRTPRPEDAVEIGMVDTVAGDRWIRLGTSRAWSWQQGCMLQWRPGTRAQVVWNDREAGRLVCRLLDFASGAQRTLPRPIYALAPDGRFALTADFARIQRMRPGYGYTGVEDAEREEKAPADDGVWRMDLETGESQLVLSLADAARLPHGDGSHADDWHYFDDLLVSPDARRFAVLHRRRPHMLYPAAVRSMVGFTTRLLTANVDGSDLHVLDPSGHTSHFVWRDPTHVCAWTRPAGRPAGFYVFDDVTAEAEPVGAGVMTRDGHVSYLPLPGHEWILNDTYADLWTGAQTLYLFHVPSGRRFDLGHFPARWGRWGYWGERRCDLHPRTSNDGRSVSIDSAHAGGRQVYLVDVGGVVDAV